MIDPSNITDYDRNEEQLQIFWLFCIMVAGKPAEYTAHKVMRLLELRPDYQFPLQWLGGFAHTDLHNLLVANRVGQYARITTAIADSYELSSKTPLSHVNVKQLEAIRGVGPKTARFFLVHSRPNQQLAVLDTHVLRWLREHHVNAPAATPQDAKKYAELESIYLNMSAAYYPKLTFAQRDLLIWAQMSGRLEV